MTESQWWWIDYMEGELDERLKRDLTQLLSLSEADQMALEKFRRLRELVRKSEPHFTASKRQAEHLHDRIMSAVRKEPKKTRAKTTVVLADAKNQLTDGEG